MTIEEKTEPYKFGVRIVFTRSYTHFKSTV